ncbi:T9SS type A sorting domain-containing protein [bacterium]|nr:T9SS type A sorting domain-containing protein [bacterium]
MKFVMIALLALLLFPILCCSQFTWDQQIVTTDFEYVYDCLPIDFDLDGDQDIVGVARNDNEVAWWENDGAQNFLRHTISGYFAGATDIHVFDFDGDGDFDVLCAGYEADEIRLFINDGAQNFTSDLVVNGFNGALVVYGADIDSDGDTDVLGGAYYDNRLIWWENDNNSYLEHVVQSGFSQISSVHAADLDLDGDMDLLATSYNGQTFAWWENNGQQEFAYHILQTNLNGAKGIRAVDFDLDGDLDVLGAATWANTLAWWENDGTMSFAYHPITNNYNHASSLIPCDMDLDGDLDLVTSATDDDDVSWWENDGAQQFTKHTLTDELNGAIKAYGADMDGDGDVDIIAAGRDQNTIALWKNVPFGLTIRLEPAHEPVLIQSRGGYVDYVIRIVNWTNQFLTFSAWSEVLLPDGTVLSPLEIQSTIRMLRYSSIVTTARFGVPGSADAGEYVYTVRLGQYPEMTWALDSFSFTKQGWSTANLVFLPDWNFEVGEFESAVELAELNDEQPWKYAVGPAFPNPFNAVTSITVDLPQASELSVVVYNAAGQHVATLESGQYHAGQHTLTIDGSSLASGIYFVHATVPGRLDQMQKVVLVK